MERPPADPKHLRKSTGRDGGRAFEGVAASTINGSGGMLPDDEAHNLKVTGSNPVPATNSSQ